MTRHRMPVEKTPKLSTELIVAPKTPIALHDAFERLRLEVIGIEALASAANQAIDEFTFPVSADRRGFHRVHALVSNTAEKAEAVVELAEHLKATVMPHSETRRQ